MNVFYFLFSLASLFFPFLNKCIAANFYFISWRKKFYSSFPFVKQQEMCKIAKVVSFHSEIVKLDLSNCRHVTIPNFNFNFILAIKQMPFFTLAACRTYPRDDKNDSLSMKKEIKSLKCGEEKKLLSIFISCGFELRSYKYSENSWMWSLITLSFG